MTLALPKAMLQIVQLFLKPFQLFLYIDTYTKNLKFFGDLPSSDQKKPSWYTTDNDEIRSKSALH